MNEPLKGKRVICPEYLDADCFNYNDVESAVEWLKQEVKTKGQILNFSLLELIDEAFPDLQNEQELNKR